jgi:hypothetical protein
MLFACVAENQPGYVGLVENLAISLRTFGGSQSRAPLVALFVDGVEDRYRARLERFGVEVAVVPRIPRGSFANKLRMLELAERRSFDVLVSLDCDTVVVNDPVGWADIGRIRAKPADLNYLTEAEWRRVFAAMDLSLPPMTLTATASGDPLPPYFNSGVIFVPKDLCMRLSRAWLREDERLSEALRRNPAMLRERVRRFVDQLSLPAALIHEGLPWDLLPPALNFPSHIRVITSSIPAEPVILHHHGEYDEQGFLYRSPTRELDPVLDRFNLARAEVLALPYRGLRSAPALKRVRTQCERTVADSRWYQSAPVAALRRRVRHAIRSSRQRTTPGAPDEPDRQISAS